jgi:S1-C subfamily serine protease
MVLLGIAAIQLPAQNTETARKRFEEIKAQAEKGDAGAQNNLGVCYAKGDGVAMDVEEAVKWYRKAAEQGHVDAQSNLGFCYFKGRGANGHGVGKDEVESLKWFRKAAEQNDAPAQFNVGACYANGDGIAKDVVEAYKWMLLAAGQGYDVAKSTANLLEKRMSREQIAEGQKLAREFKPRKTSSRIDPENPSNTATGFFITEDGYLITNEHVVKEAAQVRLVTSAGIIAAKLVKVDAANDLALLKAEGRFAALPVVASRAMRLGSTVATVGFPNVGLQGFAPKLARGEIAALSGVQDDARHFQISVPVQPGNSGGALVDERGNVAGVVSAKLSARAALAATGALPENVNYAVKSSFLLSFLESVPEVSAKLKDANTKKRSFTDVVKSAEEAAVLVLVY